MKKQTAVEQLKQDIDLEIKSGTKIVVNWDMYLAMEKDEQAINSLFIGKISEIIGFEKTVKILKECKQAIESNPYNTDIP